MSSIEERQIVRLWRQGGAKALVTLVRAEGSSYRLPGAKILIAETGYAGTVSGGCLEAEVVKKAAWMTRDGATVARYRTGFDEAGELSFGLGCGGTVDLLLEPAGTAEFEALMFAMEQALAGRAATVLSWLPRSDGDALPLRRTVIADDGTVLFASEDLERAALASAIAERLTVTGADALMEPSTSSSVSSPSSASARTSATIVCDRLMPPQRLIVVGAGDDAKPVVNMAALLGWSVTVIDGRSHLARAERFAAAEQVLVADAGSDVASALLGLQPDHAVVLMTHSYDQDRAWLAAILPLRPRYFGVLGARHRTSLLITEAAPLAGVTIAEACERICAPVGLDLGGDGPEAIALAIIAEAQAAVMGKVGRSRRLTAQDVAEQANLGGSARYAEAPCAL